jgi:outer membrane protein assembly factor BamB
VRARHIGARVAVLALALTAIPAAAGVAAASSGHAARAVSAAAQRAPLDVTTASFNNMRTGWDPNEPNLSPSVVHGSSFGQRFKTSVNGQVYAEPLVIGSTVIVATENNYVYALDAATGAVKWHTQVGNAYALPCVNIQPNSGITSTPVYDSSTGTVYVMANVNTGKSVAWRLFGLDVTNGNITFQHGIYGSPSNDSRISFNGTQELQRPGLMLLNGTVYAAFSSHCDKTPYDGYVSAVTPSNGNFTLWSDESGASDNSGGIWQSGGGIMSDGPGRIIITSGNGISPPKAPGSNPPSYLAESVIRLALQSNGTLAPQDFFSPANAPSLDNSDTDYGAAGPVGLPVGTTAYPQIIVQGSKIGTIFLLDSTNLGGREQGPNNSDKVLYETPKVAQMWGHPAVFEQSTSPIPPNSSSLFNYVYALGKKDYVRAFRIDTNGSGVPKLTDVANSTFPFGYGSGSPTVTSSGTDPSSAVVWVVQNNGGSNSTLVAFPAQPQPGKNGGVKLAEINGLPIGSATNYMIPATSNGMVYVAGGSGNSGDVYGFGVTTGAALQRSATPDFGSTPVGSATTRTVMATASRTVTVTGLSPSVATSPSPFSIGKVTETSAGGTKHVPVTFPVTLHRGDTLHARVTYAPTAPGGTSGTLTFTTAGRNVPANFPLIADATQTGLYASVPSLSMMEVLNDGTLIVPVPVGQPVYAVSTIVNGGTTPQAITKISAPGAPFAVSHLPKIGTVLQPGQSVTVSFSYTPSQAVPSNASLTVTGSHGTAATVSLTGSSQPGISKFTAPAGIRFGNVPVGHTATRIIRIVNAGNEASLVASTALSGPFRAVANVPAGLPVNSGRDLSIPVTFTPTAAGRTTGSYTLTVTDKFGPHTVVVTLAGTGV